MSLESDFQLIALRAALTAALGPGSPASSSAHKVADELWAKGWHLARCDTTTEREAHEAFHRLTALQRDAAWREIEALRAYIRDHGD